MQENSWLCSSKEPVPVSLTFDVSYPIRLTCKAVDGVITDCLVHRVNKQRQLTPRVAGMPYVRGINCLYDRLTIRMTKRSLEIFDAVSRNSKLAKLIEEVDHTACDFQLKPVAERMKVQNVNDVVLDDEETRQLRFLAEHQAIFQSDSFRQTLKEILPRLTNVKKLSFRRSTDFMRDGEHAKFAGPAISLREARTEDPSVLSRPIYLPGFFQLAAEAAKLGSITSVVMFNIAADLSFTSIRDRSIAAPVFENVEHLTLRCAGDNLVRGSDGIQRNLPPGRQGLARGEAREIEAWSHLFSKANKLRSMELGAVKVYRKRLSGASALLNMFLYHTRFRHINELRLYRQMVDADLAQRFLAGSYQQLRTARTDLLICIQQAEDNLRRTRADEYRKAGKDPLPVDVESESDAAS